MIKSNIFPAAFLLMAGLQFSCKTNSHIQSNNELKTDQVIVQSEWRVDRLHHVIFGKYSEYERNGINTTGTNYDKLRFTFHSDGTGIHVNENGKSVEFTWKFTSEDKHSLALTEYGRTDNWQMVDIKGNYMYASVNLVLNGDPNNIETFRLVKTNK
jgi:hypothetical protein